MLSLKEFAYLIGQPVSEVESAVPQGFSIEKLIKQNEQDILEASQFRYVLNSFDTKNWDACFYPGAGGDLIPDEQIGEEIPVYKTSHPDEYEEYIAMIPIKNREHYYSATFGEIPASIPMSDLLIIRNIPFSPRIFDSVSSKLKDSGYVLTFDGEYSQCCTDKGYEDVSGEFLDESQSNIRVFRKKTL